MDESAAIDGIAFREYRSPDGLFVNTLRLCVGTDVDSCTPMAVWVEPYVDPDTGEHVDGYWELDYPETILEYDGEEYGMAWAQYDLGDNPDPGLCVFFELGNVDWDDEYAEFNPIAYSGATVQQLVDWNHTYLTFDLNPPTATPWAPTAFTAIPEPNVAPLAFVGALILFVFNRRKR